MSLDRAVAVVAAGALVLGSAAMTGRAHATSPAQGRVAAAPAQGLGLDGLGLDGLGLDGLDGLGLDALSPDGVDVIGDSETVAVQRAAGNGRVATSIAASRDFRESAGTALLATANDFPDALAATALAARMGAPLLLTPPGELPEAVAGELDRLGVQRTVLLGGAGAIAPAVAADLEERGYAVTRVAGDQRFDTAADVARAVGASEGGEVLLALGSHRDADRAWADAVASSALAATGGNPPTLLTAHDRLPAATRDALQELDVQRVLLIGGESAIPPEVADQVESLGLETQRLAGTSRYGTSRAVAEAALTRNSTDTQPLVLATGEDYPDALAAGALAGALGGTVALTPSDRLASPIDELVRANSGTWAGGVVVGGPDAASGTVVRQLEAAFNGEPRPSAGDDTAPEGGDGGSESDDAAGDGSGGSDSDEAPSSESAPTPEASPTPDEPSAPEPDPSPEPDPAPDPATDDDDSGEVLATFEGEASWYGANFHGQQTACGDVFNMHELTAAHRELPCGTRVRVTNLGNGQQVTVTVNDHGPQVSSRVMDLSRAAAREIGMGSTGTATIRGEVLPD